MKSSTDLIKYQDIFIDLKTKFRTSQIKASISANRKLLEFYWYLGTKIILMQEQYKWGSKFLENLSIDLSKEFPTAKGFLKRNLKNIRQWVRFWSDENMKQLVLLIYQIP